MNRDLIWEDNRGILRGVMRIGRQKGQWLLWSAVSLLLMASGCQRYLVDTPNLLIHQDPLQVYAGCPEDCQSSVASVLYATDRNPMVDSNSARTYGYGRATTLSFGVANVSLHPHPSWQELIQESTNAKRSRQYALKLGDIQEVGWMKPVHPSAQESEPGLIISRSRVLEKPVELEQQKQFEDLLRNRLAQTPRKDVYLFVHGFNNTFEDAVFRAAEVWHFMGRVGVPIAYSWPAGRGGLRGYAYDRESGEFTVSHLRHFIKVIAECPDVERLHLVAHSRGTDVTISALRELHLGYAAQGKPTQRELKLENLVLAAPDVDEEVFTQRFVGENLLRAAHRTTIYASAHDKAIELSDLIFASRNRLGTLAVKDFSPKIKQALAKMPNVQFIECKVTGWTLSHSYVFTHPAALSDLILVLRDRRPPGAENGRPLHQPAEGVWELTDNYLAAK